MINPVLVTNPYSAREINVLPLFDLMAHDQDNFHDHSPDVMRDQMLDVAECLSRTLSQPVDNERVSIALDTVWKYVRAFERMGDRRQITPVTV